MQNLTRVDQPAEISAADAAERLGCTAGHIRNLLRSGFLTGRKFTATSWAISTESVEQYLQRPKTVGRPRISERGV
jgi:excisionase family DNA binding protein